MKTPKIELVNRIKQLEYQNKKNDDLLKKYEGLSIVYGLVLTSRYLSHYIEPKDMDKIVYFLDSSRYDLGKKKEGGNV